MTTALDDEVCCQICYTHKTESSSSIIQNTCCPTKICQDCRYKHVESIIKDRTSFRPLHCPFGCNHELTERDVRFIIKRRHTCQFWMITDTILKKIKKTTAFEWRLVLTSVLILCYGYYGFIIRVVLYILFFPFTNGRLVPCSYITVILSRWAWRRGYRSIWDFIRPGRQAVENELELYEQWSIESAVRQMIHTNSSSRNRNRSSANNNAYDDAAEQVINDVVRCPAPNCTALWLIPHQYRRCKLKSEQSSLRLILGPGEDRRMSCDKCHASFCGLCQRPWDLLHNYKSHSGRSCASYAKLCRQSGIDGEYTAAAFSVGARGCPGCTMRVQRSDGCNHMTCVCGTEWCYVCGARWSRWHYGCRDGDRQRRRGVAAAAAGCVIM
uniref:RBR-type E3 ubiquitin transferase n=1 Tax=Leptocylindrus danicus TaxID=163516 RepID=A0A7S2KR67_9STRA|mmetsp:Transcript_25109/g.37542  ORF Transcript_25109/g.37542 Transcript_25109/m.37542 type:complete len:383 (+) Transcript_25109:225-1373(+)|eukprot:CAMPEP_0116020416 /NCGR_PEP_ID=MMETSP0321-20121206/9781_1 /TAXON_ID=163516 /ORGANISM="Leptocylindrus danicus var. danicus, Strain B650" /LENGTH=382 /DNA_ID=CAMNT_0003491097 /DNA_START=156 /DNA_END=1304 /DNA_ORIENTATION=-